MNLSYIVYRIFETKWKRRIFDNATNELQQIKSNEHTLAELLENQKHFNNSTELMDLII